jgi:hypothetical protein
MFAGAGASLEPPFSSHPGTGLVATSELGIDQLAIPLPPFGLRLGSIAPHGDPVTRLATVLRPTKAHRLPIPKCRKFPSMGRDSCA